MIDAEAFKVVGDIAAADAVGYGIVSVLTVIVYLIMRAMLPAKGLANIFAPAVFWGGLVGIYLVPTFGFSIRGEPAATTAAAATAGMVGAFLVMMALVRLFEAATRIRTPLSTGTRAAVLSRSRA